MEEVCPFLSPHARVRKPCSAASPRSGLAYLTPPGALHRWADPARADGVDVHGNHRRRIMSASAVVASFNPNGSRSGSTAGSRAATGFRSRRSAIYRLRRGPRSPSPPAPGGPRRSIAAVGLHGRASKTLRRDEEQALNVSIRITPSGAGADLGAGSLRPGSSGALFPQGRANSRAGAWLRVSPPPPIRSGRHSTRRIPTAPIRFIRLFPPLHPPGSQAVPHGHTSSLPAGRTTRSGPPADRVAGHATTARAIIHRSPSAVDTTPSRNPTRNHRHLIQPPRVPRARTGQTWRH